MKKRLGVGLLLGVIVWVGASAYVGKTFINEMDAALEQAAEDPRVRLLTQEQEQGWLQSSGTLTWAYQLDLETELLITSHWQAAHRPAWVSFSGTTALLVNQDGEPQLDLLDHLDLQPIAFHGQAGLRKMTLQMPLQPLAVAEEHYHIEFSGGELQLDYAYASGKQVGKFTTDLLRLGGGQFDPSKLDLEGLQLNWSQQGVYPWVRGDLSLQLQRLFFSGAQGEVSFAQPWLKQTLNLDSEHFDLSLELTSGEVSSSGNELGQLDLAFSTDHFDGQAMADLVAFFGQEADWQALDEEAMQPALDSLNRLLEGSPALNLDQLDITLLTPFSISQKAQGSARFDGRHLPTDYLHRVARGEISEEDFAKRFRLELLFDQINPELLMLVGIPPFMLDSSAAKQSLVWEAGELRLNGERLPF